MKAKDKAETKKKSKNEKSAIDDKIKTTSPPENGPIAAKDMFAVVGIGASAGGLEAFELFLTHLPSDTGAAFVLISHLDPQHPSLLSDILRKSTRMKIVEAEDGMTLEPNHIYVIPPNKYMSVFHNALYLIAPEEPHGQRMPVDFFMRSLAEDRGENAFCIILSGTGSDGTLAIKSVNEKNGIVIVQDPATAAYDGMPRNAIRTGLADYVLPPDKMPEKIISLLSQVRHRERKPLEAMPQILSILRTKTGNDFKYYKQGTISRRIEKRMRLHELKDPSLYARYLKENPDEVSALLKDLLICVTSFFRDPKAFEILKTKGIPLIVDQRRDPKELRVWVPGCATGEEAFSIAIILQEYMEEHNLDLRVQVFATDISEDAINQARTGLYPPNIAMDVTPERLQRFFTKEQEDGYRVKKTIREMVIFAVQNIIRDAPFTHLDLISCRNLLIYLEPEIQNELIPLFQYSLNPQGILFLGTSESIGGFQDLFSVIDRKWKIFQARQVDTVHGVHRFVRQHGPPHPIEKEAVEEKPRKINMSSIFHNALLKFFAPVSVLVNSQYEIIYVKGDTGNYLRLSSGEPSRNILELSRESLKPVLSSGIYNAVSKNKASVYREQAVKIDGKGRKVNVHVKPVTGKDIPEGLAIVAFEDVPEKPIKSKRKKTVAQDEDRIKELEEENASIRESLQTTIEEMQASTEELKSMNEEMQSSNEELQSTNEELESSKEELQSMNEELTTLNAELQAKIDQLTRAESDFKVLLDGTKIGIIFLDPQLRIRRFTQEAANLINLIPTDVGRPLSDISNRFEYPDLYADAQSVINTLVPKERQIHVEKGQYFLLRIVPYRTIENVVDGAVMTMTNITEMKKVIEKTEQQK